MAYVDQYKRWWGNMPVDNCVITNANKGITIKLSSTEERTFDLPVKTYKFDDIKRTHEVVDEINSQLMSFNANVRCVLGGIKFDTKYSCLVFIPIALSEGIQITSITGTFATAYFE